MIAQEFAERVLRQVYNGFPSDDSNITQMLVLSYLGDAIGFAAKTNYKENMQLEGVGYVNNSFYTTFKGIAISPDAENFTWTLSLPKIPLGIGKSEGISSVRITDNNKQFSLDLIPLSENQKTFYATMRNIPNKTLYYYEADKLYIKSTLLLNKYTATVTMISGSSSGKFKLTDTLNVPDDYIPMMVDYVAKILMIEKRQPVDSTSEGVDLPN